jgi:hypothetical protein
MTTSFEIPHDRHRSPLGDLLATGGSLVHQGQKAPQAALMLHSPRRIGLMRPCG